MIRKAVKNDKLSVKIENLTGEISTASMLTVDEQEPQKWRHDEDVAASGMGTGMPDQCYKARH